MNGENLLFFFSFSYEKKVRRRRRIFFFSLFIPGSSVGASTTIATVAEGEIERERKKKGSPTGHDSTGMVKTWNHGAGVSTRKKKKQQLKKSFDFPSFWFFVLPTRQTVSSVSTDQSMNLH